MNIFIPLWILLLPLILIGISITFVLIYFICCFSIEALNIYCETKGIYKLFVQYMIENRPKKQGRKVMK